MISIKSPKQIHGTPTEESHEISFQKSLKKRGVDVWTYIGPKVPVFISEAKLVILCPNCRGGVSVSIEWKNALCRGCGARFSEATLELPSQKVFEEIADVLAVRPELHRCWLPWRSGETPDDHRAENMKRGYPKDRKTRDEEIRRNPDKFANKILKAEGKL